MRRGERHALAWHEEVTERRRTEETLRENALDLRRLAAHLVAQEVGGSGHPVDRLYVTNRNFNRLTDRKVELVDGKITCDSCHNPYRSEKARLVKTNAQSNLCLTCHRK